VLHAVQYIEQTHGRLPKLVRPPREKNSVAP
jgi:hypothetical protein